jgi:hypothetical protein
MNPGFVEIGYPSIRPGGPSCLGAIAKLVIYSEEERYRKEQAKKIFPKK